MILRTIFVGALLCVLFVPQADARPKHRQVPQGLQGVVAEGAERVVGGRRTDDEVRALDWTGDPEPWLPVLPLFRPSR